MTPPPLGIAVLGSGDQALRAAGAIRKVPALNLLGIWSRDPARARRAAESSGAPAFHDLDRLWEQPSLKAVFIAAESHRHAELGMVAARAGRHVLTEKPLDASLPRAEALAAACKDAGVLLSVVSQKRFSPRWRRVKALLDAGTIGRPVSAALLVRISRPDAYFSGGNGWRGDATRGGGVILNQGIHWADLLCWWLGEPEEVRGLEGRRREGLGAPETTGGTVRFAGGAVATLLLSTATTGLPEFLELTGERGAVQVEGGRVRVWDVPGEGTRGLLGPLTRRLPLPLRTALTVESLCPPVDGTLSDQLAHFASAATGLVPLESTGEEGLRALRLAGGLVTA